MKTCFKYGAGIAVAITFISLVFFALGFHSDATKMAEIRWVSPILVLIVSIAGTIMGIRARRAEVPPEKGFSYGQALAAGVMIAVFCGLVGMVTNYIYTQFLNPKFGEVTMQMQANAMSARGMSDDQIEKSQSVMKVMFNPVLQAGAGLIGTVFFGTLLSLIVAAFMKKPAPEPPLA